MTRRRSLTIKDAAWQVMEQAYMKASANGRLPALLNQIMYAARPQILALVEHKDQLGDAYFTQKLLPEYMEQNACGWNHAFTMRAGILPSRIPKKRWR